MATWTTDGIVGGATVTYGTISSVTGTANFANASSAFLTTIQAGNALAARTYTLPTDFGSAGTVLTDAAGNGTLSWGAAGGTPSLTLASTTITGGTTTRILYDNAGVLGEYTLTGTGTVVVMATSPTLVTPVLGVATATSINKMAVTAPATSSTLAVADGKTLTASNTLTLTATDGSTLAIGAGGTLGLNAYISTVFAPLASPTFTGQVTAPVIKVVQTNKGTVGTGTVTFDTSVSSQQRLQVSGNLTIAFSNWPASGTYGEIGIQAVNWGSATVTTPTINWHVGDGTTSTTFSNTGVTLATSGTNRIVVWSYDGGTTLYGNAQ